MTTRAPFFWIFPTYWSAPPPWSCFYFYFIYYCLLFRPVSAICLCHALPYCYRCRLHAWSPLI